MIDAERELLAEGTAAVPILASILLAAESAAALIRCGEADHAEVVRVAGQSAQAAKHIALMQRHLQHEQLAPR